MKKYLLIVFIIVLNTLIFSHYHWLKVSNYHPGINEEIKVYICSGHHFPKSTLALKNTLIYQPLLYHNGVQTAYKTIKDQKYRRGKIKITDTGLHILSFALKRPQQNEALYYSKLILNWNQSKKFDPQKYMTGADLEIVPQNSLVKIKENADFKFMVYYRKKIVKTNCNVSVEGENVIYLHPDKDNILDFKIKRGKIYLISTSYKGKGCSLTFKTN